MPTDVKTKDFTEPEARRLTIRAVLKGDLSPEGSVVMLAAVAEAQEEEVTQLRAALGYVNETLRLLKEFRARACKAAWAVGLTNRSGFSGEINQTLSENFYLALEPHSHQLLTDEQCAALAALAAEDTSGYAPAPVDAGVLIEGTGTGEPPVPPRYETRPGAMHRGSSGLPATGARRS